MPENKILENVFGTIGTILWSVQLVPQIIKSHRSKDTSGLSTWLLLIWLSGSIPQGTYLVVENINIPLIVQPQLFSFFCLISLSQCWQYSHGKSKTFCFSSVLLLLFLLGGLELGLYYLCKLGESRGNSSGTKVMGILGAILIVLGLVPQYYEIWKYKEVKGISFIFLAVDCSGAIFSTLSLVFKERFDGIAAANYIGILVLEIGIFLIALIINPKAERRRRTRLDQEGQGEGYATVFQDGLESVKITRDDQGIRDLGTSQHVAGPTNSDSGGGGVEKSRSEQPDDSKAEEDPKGNRRATLEAEREIEHDPNGRTSPFGKDRSQHREPTFFKTFETTDSHTLVDEIELSNKR